jgi:hypothetical protein
VSKSREEKAAYLRAWRDQNPDHDRRTRKTRRTSDGSGSSRERRQEEWRRYAREVRQPIINREKLLRGACLVCGLAVTVDNLVAFDFDHRDPATKRGRGVSGSSTHYIEAEMAKCDLLCANCHRIKTWREKDILNVRGFIAIDPGCDPLF